MQRKICKEWRTVVLYILEPRTLDEIAKKFMYTRCYISEIFSALRKNGIELRRIKGSWKGRKHICITNINKINAIFDSIEPKGKTGPKTNTVRKVMIASKIKIERGMPWYIMTAQGASVYRALYPDKQLDKRV